MIGDKLRNDDEQDLAKSRTLYDSFSLDIVSPIALNEKSRSVLERINAQTSDLVYVEALDNMTAPGSFTVGGGGSPSQIQSTRSRRSLAFCTLHNESCALLNGTAHIPTREEKV